MNEGGKAAFGWAKVTSSCGWSIPAFGQKLRLSKSVQRASAGDEDRGENKETAPPQVVLLFSRSPGSNVASVS